MFAYAMPRQYTILVDCPYVIVPLFKCSKLNAEWVSKLNPLTTAWCVAENIMLAVINEGLGYSLRIPLNKEHNIVLEKLGVRRTSGFWSSTTPSLTSIFTWERGKHGHSHHSKN